MFQFQTAPHLGMRAENFTQTGMSGSHSSSIELRGAGPKISRPDVIDNVIRCDANAPQERRSAPEERRSTPENGTIFRPDVMDYVIRCDIDEKGFNPIVAREFDLSRPRRGS